MANLEEEARSLKVAELKNVLERLRLPKSGRKEELVQKVLWASRGGFGGVMPHDAVKAVKREKELSQRSTDVMRASTNEMHQPGQHTSSSPSRPGAEQLAESEVVRRVREADPFWAPPLIGNEFEVVLSPRSLSPVWQGGDKVLALQLSFAIGSNVLNRRDESHQIHLVSVLEDDKVPRRIHWPCNADVRVNGTAINVPHRSKQHALGPNARDPPAPITSCVGRKNNTLMVKARDWRRFFIMIRFCRRRSISEVREKVPRSPSLDECMKNVKQHCGKFAADEEMEVEDNPTIPLVDPISSCRIAVPARFQACDGLRCFDMDTFLQMAQRSRKWLCPHCLAEGNPETIVIDTFLLSILRQLDREGRSDAIEIEIREDASWRPITEKVTEGEETLSEEWRSPSSIEEATFDPASDPIRSAVPFSQLHEGSNRCKTPKDEPQADRSGGRGQNVEPEVIILDDSDDDDNNTGAPQRQQQQSTEGRARSNGFEEARASSQAHNGAGGFPQQSIHPGAHQDYSFQRPAFPGGVGEAQAYEQLQRMRFQQLAGNAPHQAAPIWPSLNRQDLPPPMPGQVTIPHQMQPGLSAANLSPAFRHFRQFRTDQNERESHPNVSVPSRQDQGAFFEQEGHGHA